MEPGTGKTRAAVELINSSKADFVLWMTPFQTKKNLKKELIKWHLQKPYRIEGIESLSNSDGLYLDLREKLQKHKRVFMVCDESLKIKNQVAIRTQRAIKLGQLCHYRLVLNGTPLSKNLLDIWTQMEFLSPKILKMDYYEYLNTFIKYNLHDGPSGHFIEILGNENIDYLYSLIEPYVFEAKLSLGINKNENDIDYLVYDDKRYYELKDEMLSRLSGMRDIEFLGLVQQMQQSYSLDKGHLSELNDLLTSIDGNSIIFVKYIATEDYLSQTYPQCRVLTYGKGSLGLNLQKYSNIVFYDKTWDYAQLEQAKRRIYRIGQRKDINYYFMTSNLGLDKMINGSIKNKRSLLDTFKAASKKEMFANEF